jgi:molybdopterin converting factor small subunit
MKFDVALFAYHREQFGGEISVEADPIVSAVLAALSAIGIDVSRSRLAVDEKFAEDSEDLNSKSRLALIPPVSGG